MKEAVDRLPIAAFGDIRPVWASPAPASVAPPGVFGGGVEVDSLTSHSPIGSKKGHSDFTNYTVR